MKIYKDLNIMVVKDKKLELFKGYRLWIMLGILSSIAFTALIAETVTETTPIP